MVADQKCVNEATKRRFPNINQHSPGGVMMSLCKFIIIRWVERSGGEGSGAGERREEQLRGRWD